MIKGDRLIIKLPPLPETIHCTLVKSNNDIPLSYGIYYLEYS